MRIIGILLVILGVVGTALSSMMFGDIGIAGMIASLSSLLAGIGFCKAHKRLKGMERK